MTDPIKKLRADVLAAYTRADGNASAERDAIKRVFSAFAEEYEAVEVDASRDNGASLWDTYRSPGSGKNDTRRNPQTILVPRKTVSLLEVLKRVQCLAHDQRVDHAKANDLLDEIQDLVAAAIKRAGGGE